MLGENISRHLVFSCQDDLVEAFGPQHVDRDDLYKSAGAYVIQLVAQDVNSRDLNRVQNGQNLFLVCVRKFLVKLLEGEVNAGGLDGSILENPI